ncbi:unnamed protein product [marine sediment metagenome]|uniref:Uncharacterized protein n=1 Tax=marine sediment metagenome TaxID=412755 RepID=X1CHH8_9ZZZZ
MIMEAEEFKDKFDKIVEEHQNSRTLEDIRWLIADLEELFSEWEDDNL